ncbi:hypothetical protein ACFSTI_21175 [Rhizorhabdus histidinilytica]
MQAHDIALRDAWGRFCDELKAKGDIIFRETAASNPVDRAAESACSPAT